MSSPRALRDLLRSCVELVRWAFHYEMPAILRQKGPFGARQPWAGRGARHWHASLSCA